MKRYVISDTHFFHKNIIPYADRPFKDVDEMNNYMIEQWQNTVNDDDIVYHLGDVFWYPSMEKMKQIMNQLTGYKILIKGNHDTESDRTYLRAGFNEVYNELIVDGYLLTHHPVFERELRRRIKEERIKMNICGHVHLDLFFLTHLHICACVEWTGYKPILFEELIARGGQDNGCQKVL